MGETSAVSGVRVMIVHPNRHRKSLHPLSHQSHDVDVCREKEASEAEVRLSEFFDNRADTFFVRYLYDIILCKYQHPPECQFYETE